MIDEGRACSDVLTQIAAVQEALRGVSRDLLRGHADRCLRKRGGHEELIELLHRFTR
ncbi:MAG: metal-sensing transcriptional repressor [Bryobacter sp.]|nr:metal-sensing transcriptional repressor [Bryobacter sp.]